MKWLNEGQNCALSCLSIIIFFIVFTSAETRAVSNSIAIEVLNEAIAVSTKIKSPLQRSFALAECARLARQM